MGLHATRIRAFRVHFLPPPDKHMPKNETWKPTHNPYYDISNLGRVRSWHLNGGNTKDPNRPKRRKTPVLLRPGIASHGYPTVSFGRKEGSQCVHVLVAAAFVGPCPDGQEVRHKDDNRANPRADNLEYGTRQDNVNDMMARGRHKAYDGPRDWHGRLMRRDALTT